MEAQRQRTGMVHHLFQDHPRSLGMSWWDHGLGAIKIGAEMIVAGGACLIHAFVPAWFTQTAGRTVERLHEHMVQRRAGAANPNEWPDYEI